MPSAAGLMPLKPILCIPSLDYITFPFSLPSWHLHPELSLLTALPSHLVFRCHLTFYSCAQGEWQCWSMTQCFRADTAQHLSSQFWWWVGGGGGGCSGIRQLVRHETCHHQPVARRQVFRGSGVTIFCLPPHPLVFLVEAVHGLACAYVD